MFYMIKPLDSRSRCFSTVSDVSDVMAICHVSDLP